MDDEIEDMVDRNDPDVERALVAIDLDPEEEHRTLAARRVLWLLVRAGVLPGPITLPRMPSA